MLLFCFRWERDPKGKYAYGATCVKECPEHLLKDNGACVRSCPEKFRVSARVNIIQLAHVLKGCLR